MDPQVTITDRGEQRVRDGHPWIYRTDVHGATASPGDIVAVVSRRGATLGQALFSDRSQITLRMLTYGDAPADDELWRTRLRRAVAFREALALEATAYRLVHGEADLLPSLIVDRYGSHLVVQALSQAVDRLLPRITAWLVELLSPLGILARNDPRVRVLEGLAQRVELLDGTVPDSIEVREGPVRYDVDVWKGQKTGLFLDQRENREAATRYAKGRLLDCFSYHGGFALRLASHCTAVEAIDVSSQAVSQIRLNASRNGAQQIVAREANVFDELRRLEQGGETYDTIVLDPPAFAKNKASVPNAVAGYKQINLRALRMLNPGGCLVTCSCSYNIDERLFSEILQAAALDSHRAVTVVEKRMQGRDHPVLLGVPEMYYLKCFILRRIE